MKPRRPQYSRWARPGRVTLASAICQAGLVLALAVSTAPTAYAEQPAPDKTSRLDLTEKVPRHLPLARQFDFIAGRSFFSDTWVAAGATTTLRDGLGPHYSARSCAVCHQGGGRSTPEYTATYEQLAANTLTLRFDEHEPDQHQAGNAPLLLGTTWNAFAVPAARLASSPPPEGRFESRVSKSIWHYPDGSAIALRRPEFRLVPSSPVPTGPSTQVYAMSARVAPDLALINRIDAVDPAAILALADPEDRNSDGISGRVHPSLAKSANAQPGRFGLKARHATLASQVAAAFQEDIGITSSLFPHEACGTGQHQCTASANGRGARVGGLAPDDPAPVYEISDENLAKVLVFLRNLNAPAEPKNTGSSTGKTNPAFTTLGCAACHTPGLAARPGGTNTRPGTSLQLYSDLLLHDMGADLADTGSAGQALSREWRTAPLARIGLRPRLSHRTNYLHDGRARTLEEAILWHGGEAAQARKNFARLAAPDRQALLQYLGKL